jgi:anti-sigma B factor antagonist
VSDFNCPKCGLVLTRPSSQAMIENCPRCIARRRQIVKLVVTDDEPRAREAGRSPRGACAAGIPGELRISDEISAGVRTFALAGELDLASTPLLRSMLGQIATDGVQRIRIDLSGLAFIDSTGVHALFGARNICLAHGYEFSLVPGSPSVQRIFEIAGLTTILPFEQQSASGSTVDVAI